MKSKRHDWRDLTEGPKAFLNARLNEMSNNGFLSCRPRTVQLEGSDHKQELTPDERFARAREAKRDYYQRRKGKQ